MNRCSKIVYSINKEKNFCTLKKMADYIWLHTTGDILEVQLCFQKPNYTDLRPNSVFLL